MVENGSRKPNFQNDLELNHDVKRQNSSKKQAHILRNKI